MNKPFNLYFSLASLLFLAGTITFPGCQSQIVEQQVSTQMVINPSDHWPAGVTYEIFVQSFADSDGDGIGDIKGMQSKLDYLADLGVEALWLMPIGPSPSYHKYDVTDYKDIHPDYGTLEDFKAFVTAAHERNIKVVMDLVINHSGKGHPWFTESEKGKNNPYRDYYVWADDKKIATTAASEVSGPDSDNRDRWNEVPNNEEKYYSYFGGHMPDLNYDSEKLRQEIFDIGKFWLVDIGVDGFRLDAARHIFPDDRAKDNHQWWKVFRAEMEKAKPEVYLVGEVWAPAEVVAPYMAGLHALFNFDLGSRIVQVVNLEDGTGLVDSLKSFRDFYASIEPGFIDATFLTNHDQVRIRSAVGNSMEKSRLAASILFTLPGSPYIYYGEEIGMLGQKPDPNIREPFLWSEGKSDKDRPSWINPEYSTDQTIVPVSVQRKDSKSIFNHYRTLMHLRKTETALFAGDIQSLPMSDHHLLAYFRINGGENLLVIHNLSGESMKVNNLPETQTFSQPIFRTSQENGFDLKNIVIEPYGSIILK